MKRFKRFPGIFSVFAFFVFSSANAQSYVPVWNDVRIKVKPATNINAYAFDLKDVQLLESPFTKAMQADVAYLLKIDANRLLADFRAHAGLQPKGERYGGWESSGLAGHSLGHYLSAVSMAYASTKNPEFLRRANYITDQLDECQKARKTGYLGAFPKEDSMWAEVAKGNIRSRGFDLNGAWSPWYTVHKIMGGLLDAYLYTNNEKALQIVSKLADWTGNEISGLSDPLMQKMLVTEYGGMNDALVNTYALTGNKKYLDLSYRFYDRRILDSLAAQTDVLPGKHSNTQIPKIIGSARRYQLTGDAKDSSIANFFWQTVTKHHSYATGGNSNYEYLGAPDKLNDFLTDNTTETCNTYNMLKLTSQLFASNPSAGLMDFYEKALYNHILASQNHSTGMMTYFVSLRMGGQKEYSDEFNTFTCCVGTGMENHVKYGENIYYRGKDGSLYVNLFIPSVLDWRKKGVTIKQETNLPASGKTTFTISASKATAFALRIRQPRWAGNVKVSVNGVKQNIAAGKNGYLTINKKWAKNDKVDIEMEQHFYTESMPDNANRKAVFYGPVLLAGVLGDKEPEPADVPVFVTAETDANKWMKPAANQSLVFNTSNISSAGEVKMVPFNQTANEHYSVYWDVFTPEQWAVQQKIYEKEKSRQKMLEAQTTDNLRLGEMQPERDHNVTGEKLSTGDEHNRKWRAAGDSGFISFTMKTDPKQNNRLICTYWGMDNRGRIFDIFINDQLIATEDLNKYKSSKFYDIIYPVPAEITNNKNQVTVKFVPKTANSAGPVYGVKMVKGNVDELINTK